MNSPASSSVSEGGREKNVSVRFEPRDVNTTAVTITLLILAATVVAVMLLLIPIYGNLMSRSTGATPPASPLLMDQRNAFPPPPRLQGGPGDQVPPQEQLGQMRAQANAQLNSYGWVDQSHGIAHIPIEEAMKLLAERGLSAGSPGLPTTGRNAVGAKSSGPQFGGANSPNREKSK